VSPAGATAVPLGITPFDERVGGLEPGGTYLVVGTPGPAKMVATLQFLHEGLSRGDHCLLVTNADADGILTVARAWGFDMQEAWENGALQLVGLRDDFELRAIRSIEPVEVLEELDGIVVGEPSRIAVDPGSMFLTGGAKTLLGAAFMTWARRHTGTVLATFSLDGDPSSLPAAADWLINATTGRLIVTRASDGLYQITLARPLPGIQRPEETISLELEPGLGLIRPRELPTRRGADRLGLDRNHVLLVSLGGSHASDLEAWARRTFETDVVAEPFEAVATVQSAATHGCILVHAERRQVRHAVQACRALRPLTPAAIVFASDDAIRSTDRIHILEAGADDCLSGGLDFRELAVRMKQSMALGARPALVESDSKPVARVVPRAGRVSLETFAEEIRRRADDQNLTFFCVLDVTANGVSPTELEQALVELVRSDAGDMVCGDDDRCLVLLQGTRQKQLGPFLERLRVRLRERTEAEPSAEVTVLSHPSDSSRIQQLVETPRVEAR
jgi:CheY-like chemotaxis protein